MKSVSLSFRRKAAWFASFLNFSIALSLSLSLASCATQTNTPTINVLSKEPTEFYKQTCSLKSASQPVEAGGLDEAILLTQYDSQTGRNPASNVKAGAASDARSQIPKTVSQGIEMRVKSNNETAAFWVVKRNEKFSFVYANSSGTKTAKDLADNTFRNLYAFAGEAIVAREPQSIDGAVACAGSTVQLFVVGRPGPEKTKTVCIDAKRKPSEKFFTLGQMLANLVK